MVSFSFACSFFIIIIVQPRWIPQVFSLILGTLQACEGFVI